MSRQATIGKQQWRRRAPGYAAQLRGEIDRDAGARLAGWQARGRLPVWFKVKRRLRAWMIRHQALRLP